MSEFERLYKETLERCLEENGELYESYSEFQMKNISEYFYNLGRDLNQLRLNKLEQQLKEAEKVIDFYADAKPDILFSESVIKIISIKAREYKTKYELL